MLKLVAGTKPAELVKHADELQYLKEELSKLNQG